MPPKKRSKTMGDTPSAELTLVHTFTPRPVAVIDAAAFPHLVELILSFASYEALIILRGVSRSLKHQADKHLNTGRVIVTAEGIDDIGVTVSSVHGYLPAFASWTFWERMLYADSENFPDTYYATVSSVLLASSPLTFPPHTPFHPDLLSLTTTVDVDGPVPRQYAHTLIHGKTGRSPRTIRIIHQGREHRPDGYPAWAYQYMQPADTVVTFAYIDDYIVNSKMKYDWRSLQYAPFTLAPSSMSLFMSPTASS